MFRPRIIPCLLLKDLGLVKTVKFKNPRYIGDPINAVRIFNAKEADEIIFLDISATKEGRTLPLDLLQRIGDECFMPFAVGGGIRSIQTIREILSTGAEKVVINTYAVENPGFIREAADIFGSSTIVVGIDAKKKLFDGYEVMKLSGTRATGLDPAQFAVKMQEMGAGEILINSIDRDGTMEGYDIDLTKKIADAVSLPVIACGGAGSMRDFVEVIKYGNATAVAAGSYFVYHGRRRAVLINFPTCEEQELLYM
jgi:cyclase